MVLYDHLACDNSSFRFIIEFRKRKKNIADDTIYFFFKSTFLFVPKNIDKTGDKHLFSYLWLVSLAGFQFNKFFSVQLRQLQIKGIINQKCYKNLPKISHRLVK